MWMRMRKSKKDDWEKVEVNFIDFFLFNFVAGLALSLLMTTLAVLIFAIV